MADIQFYGGIVFIALGFARLVGMFWQPLGRYGVDRTPYATISDSQERQRTYLGMVAQTLAFILFGTTGVLVRMNTATDVRLIIALCAALLAAVPIIFKIIYPER